MMVRSIPCLALASVLIAGSCLQAREEDRWATRASNLAFRLPAIDGTTIEVASHGSRRWTVICFLGTECPLAQLYADRLNQLAEDFASRDVQFLGLGSNSQDSVQDLQSFATRHDLRFPIARDLNNRIADQYAAMRTPEVFVLDHRLQIVYRGRIDDQYLPGIARSEPTRADLRIALDEVLAGGPVSVAETEVAGCLIGRVRTPTNDNSVTFHEQVAPMLREHCIECHRPGEIGPFSMTEYEEVAGWAETMLETMDDGRMPPWHAHPAYGHFQNERRLPDSARQLLQDWIEAGMPEGDASKPIDAVEFARGWRLPRHPDLELAIRDRPFRVPAQGTVEYQYFVVDPQFEQDCWVSAAEVVPGNRSVVHHAIAFVRPPDGARFRGVGWLAAYVPGQRQVAFPPGHAIFVPAASKLVFQMHYTPNGREQDDLTRIGLVFASDQEVTHEVFTLVALNQQFEIPPHAGHHEVRAAVEDNLPAAGELLAIAPHMHLRGKSFRLFAKHTPQADAPVQILLDVPRYDFNWQHSYRLREPLSLGDIKSLEFAATFDNSADNPVNPDPDQHVTWGDQTWEEMAVAFFEVAVPREPASVRQPVAESGEPALPPDRERRAEAFARSFLERFDANQDGLVDPDETSLAFRSFGFYQFDLDGDRRLSKNELVKAALWQTPQGP